MARGIAKCTCSTCGSEFEIVKYGFPNRRSADSWEEWATGQANECYECRKIRHRNKEAAKGLLVSYSPDLDSALQGEFVCIASFSGDTFNRKEELKKLGCKWNPASGHWQIKLPAVLEEKDGRFSVDLAADGHRIRKRIENELGAKKIGALSRERKYACVKAILAFRQKQAEKEIALAEIGEKPDLPDEFTQLRNGRRWNGKIYGAKEKSVYFDGEKVALSLELAREVEKTQDAIAEWENKKAQILG